MSDCFYIPECEFFQSKLANMPMSSEFMKMEYCYKNPGSCARLVFKLNNINKSVPDDLMPHEIARLDMIK